MAEQILNGILTTLAADIASSGPIPVAAIPAATWTGTVRCAMGSEILSATGYSGTGPYTLLGVVRGIEGTTAASHASGTAFAIGFASAGSLAGNNVNNRLSAHLATTAALSACTYANGTTGVGATLTKTSNGALSVDGVAAVAGMRILVTKQATAANNGLYEVTAAGDASHPFVLTRTQAIDEAIEFFGTIVTVGPLGTTNANSTWEFTATNNGTTIVVGTDPVSFSIVGSSNSCVCDVLHQNGTRTYFNSLANSDASAGSQIASALASAVSGDTIYVYRNATVTGNLAKTGVNWWFAPGVVITMSMTTEGFIFTDDPTGGGTGTACSYTVGGGGTFVRNGTNMDVSGGSGNLGVVGVLAVVNTGSAVSFEFDKMIWTYTGTPPDVGVASVIKHWNGSLTLRGNLLLGSTDPADTSGNNVTTVLGWYTGEFNGEIGQIIYTGDTTVTTSVCIGFGPNISNLNQTFRLSCETIQVVATQTTSIPAGTGAYAISMEETAAGNATWITAKTIYGGVHIIGGGKLYVDCQKLFGYVIVDQQDSDSEAHLTIEKVGGNFSASTDAIRILNSASNANTSKSWISVRTFDAGTNWVNLINQSAGTLWFNGSDITAASGQDAILVSGGTANIVSGLISTGVGHNDLKQTGGTLKVTAAVEYDASKTTGTITKAKIFGNAPGTSSGTLV